MILRYISAVLIPVVLVAVVFFTALPELGYKTKAEARSGDPAAQVRLARMYYAGEELEVDQAKAVEWLQKAADQQYPEALFTLGQFYVNGHVVKKDEAKGMTMVNAAAEADYPQAQWYLAVAYGKGLGVKQDIDQFLYWVKRGAKTGSPQAQFNLALLKLTGRLVERNVPEAKHLLELSANQDFTEAQATLGEFLARGIEGKPDLVEACKWFAIAGTKGHAHANKFLMAIVKNMTKEQMDEAADRANAWLDARDLDIQ